MSDNDIKDPQTPTAIEQFHKDSIIVPYKGESFTFKIPSAKDRIRISSVAAQLRRESDPNGMGVVYGYDPYSLLYTEGVATFLCLLKETDAKWVFSPDETGKPKINIDKWEDNVPVVEVVDQFNKELETFRSSRN